jgi:hypothetical protein
MMWLEAVRQEQFGADTLDVWYFEICRLGWTADEFRKAVVSVSRAKIYGKVTFDNFLNAEDLYTNSEVVSRVNQIIENRKRLAEQQGFTEEDLVKEGLMNIQIIWDRKRLEILEKIQGRIEKRAKKVEWFIRNCDETTREEILQIAVDKGVIVKDKFWNMILPLTAPYLLDEVEPMYNRKHKGE